MVEVVGRPLSSKQKMSLKRAEQVIQPFSKLKGKDGRPILY